MYVVSVIDQLLPPELLLALNAKGIAVVDEPWKITDGNSNPCCRCLSRNSVLHIEKRLSLCIGCVTMVGENKCSWLVEDQMYAQMLEDISLHLQTGHSVMYISGVSPELFNVENCFMIDRGRWNYRAYVARPCVIRRLVHFRKEVNPGENEHWDVVIDEDVDDDIVVGDKVWK